MDQNKKIVRLKLDASPLWKALLRFKTLLHVRYELINFPVGFFETFQEFVSLENQGTIDPLTGELRIVLNPSESFRELLAAMGTGNRDFSVLAC